MRKFALQQTAVLIHRLSTHLDEASKEAAPDSIHDVRVVIRRLSRCLRVFSAFYPNRSWKKIRSQLSALMAAAGAVRDCDVALELLGQAGITPRSAAIAHIKAERKKAGEEFLAEIHRWKRRGLLDKWKDRLEVNR